MLGLLDQALEFAFEGFVFGELGVGDDLVAVFAVHQFEELLADVVAFGFDGGEEAPRFF